MRTIPLKPNLAPFVQSICVTLFLGLLTPGIAHAQDYLGASAVLHQVEERNAKPGQKPEKDEATKLLDDLKSFSQTSTNLAPADAAKRWLELVDRAVKVQQQSVQNYNPSAIPVQPDDMLGALPPPADWSGLAKAIAARPPAMGGGAMREAGLRLLAASLTGDAAGRSREITNLQTMAKGADYQSAYFYNDILGQIGQALLTTSPDPNMILKSLGYQLVYADGQGVRQLQVPNLVSAIGAEKSKAFLRQALVTPNVMLHFSSPNETSRLAQKLALELIDQLKTPQWGLVNSLDAVALYEALDKKFGVQTNSQAGLPGISDLPDGVGPVSMGDDNLKQEAEVYYLLGLISKGRTQDAVAVAKKLKGQTGEYMSEQAFKAMENAGYAEALDNFLHELLSQDPTLPFWNEYVEVAARASQPERMLALVRVAVARDDVSDKKKTELHQILFIALLANNDVDGAVQEARQLIALDTTNPSNNGYNAGQLGVMIANIGVLLQKPELTEEGISVAKKWLATPAGQKFAGGEAGSVVESLSQILFELKRGPEAESILTDALVNADRTRSMQADIGWYGAGPPARQILAALATLYYKAGRYDDVLLLLEQSPDWGAKDLSELFDSSWWYSPVAVMSLPTGISPMPVPYLAASSLMSKDKNEQARKITDALLNRCPGLDRGYELLLALDGTNAMSRLNELFSLDQFEERPLIWKAHLLQQENQLAEAEKVARQAIAIDPTDGEEGRGDRLRAYSELADILDARGDTKDADYYHGIVKAVRMSEDADQFYQAGLLSRAIPMYEQALDHFSDAYCIQVRLAIQLAALGKNEEAEEHYRRAYELMPDSFGRVESHCFGCERDFEGERAQNVAEKIFNRMAVKEPNKPQVYYLLGYLHQQQEHYREALTNYLIAVRLDPDYLNAWVKLQDVSAQTLASPQLEDEIAFNILRLDPLQRHAQADYGRVNDLRKLWEAVADAISLRPPLATNLLTLDASKIALDKKQAGSASAQRAMQFEIIEQTRTERENVSPAFAIAQTPFVHIAGQMIINGNNDFGSQ
jgi:tetratricopeptide (TPR) repeat protein